MSEAKRISIAIDGPSGAGKSTLARLLAEQFELMYIDTGAIYRCVGLFVLENSTEPDDGAAVEALLPEMDIVLRHEDGLQRMLLNGKDVTNAIRMPEVSMAASAVSAIPAVRAFLLEMQREFAKKYDVVMDGRDIGTVVLPDASLKIFLTATAKDRAGRRYEELCTRGVGTTYEEVFRDIVNRDENDSNRSAAPLKPAENAVILDTTGNSLNRSRELLVKLVKERLAHVGSV